MRVGSAVDPDADTLVPDAPDETGLAIDPEADTLVPNSPDETNEAEDPEDEPARSDISQDKNSDDPLAKLYSPPEDPTGEPAPEPVPEPTPAPPIPVEIEPQPYVSEQFSSEKIVVETKPQPTKGSARPVMLALGFFVLLFIAAGIIALVYYFLYMNRADTGGF